MSSLLLMGVASAVLGCRPAPCPADCTRVWVSYVGTIDEKTQLQCTQQGQYLYGVQITSCQNKPQQRVLTPDVCENDLSAYRCKRAGTCEVVEDVRTALSKCLCPKQQLLTTYVPFQVWPVLDESVVGLVFTAPHDARRSISWLHSFDVHNTYRFSVNGLSPQVLYWPTSGQSGGVNSLTNWQVQTKDEGVHLYDAAMFGPSHLPGLTGAAHVVRLTINRGAGSDRNIHFVATSTQVLDGRRGVPSNPSAVLDSMWQRAEAYFTQVEGRIQQLLFLAQLELNPQNAHTVETLPSRTGFAPTWMEKESCLRATFMTTRPRMVVGPETCRFTSLRRGPWPCFPPRRYPFGVQAGLLIESCGGTLRVVEEYRPKVYADSELPLSRPTLTTPPPTPPPTPTRPTLRPVDPLPVDPRIE